MTKISRGWLMFKCYPYNDHLPFVPFTVEYWIIFVILKMPRLKEFRLWRYKRKGHAFTASRRRLYAPQPYGRVFDSALWTGRA